jgi:tetratricopeptide (TPR) repeat protein
MNVFKRVSILVAFCFLFPGLGFTVESPLDSLVEEELLKPEVDISEFDQPLPQSPANDHYAQGMRHLKENKLAKATEAFKAALEQDNKHVPTLMALAGVAFTQNRLAEAESACKRAIDLDPKNARWRIAFARILLAQKKIPAAEIELQTAADLAPKSVHPRVALGNMYYVLGKSEDALKEYEAAVALSPGSPEPHLSIATTYARMRQFDKALKAADALKHILDRGDPLNPTALMLKGALYSQQKQYDRAIEQYKAAIAKNFRHYQAHLNLGNIYTQLIRFDAAIESYKNAISVKPNAPRAYLMLGQIYIAHKQLAEAKTAYENVLKLNPNVPVAQNNLAWIYAENEENLNEAIQMAESAKKLVPGSIQILDTLGWVYYKKGDYQKALENIMAAIQSGAREAEVYYHLGLIHVKMDNKSDAQEAFRQALTLNPNYEKADEIQTMLWDIISK